MENSDLLFTIGYSSDFFPVSIPHCPICPYFAPNERIYPFPLLLVCILSACSGREQKETSENDLDAARNFIRSALDGRWDDARKYMIQDSVKHRSLTVTKDGISIP